MDGRNGVARWEEQVSQKGLLREGHHATSSGIPVRPLYGPEDIADLDYERDLGYPGQYPYTRGVYDTMYRGKLWTMRLFSGYATAEETNRRYHFLLDRGQTGLSVAFDMPTLMGYDSDHAMSLGEVGKCGVAVDSLADMETLFKGIPLGDISVSMTINGPAAILMAYYIVAAEKQGVPVEKLRGTIQADILKEYIAQKEWLFPPEAHMRIMVDMIEYATHKMPYYHPVSISGYHIREAGATAVQELAFTLADGFAYVEACIERGLPVDSFAPRLSFFFDCHNDFFEEIAKFRAARRIWARRMRDKYGAKNPKSLLMRFHTQTAGVSLTAQQPENNIVRTAYQAMAAVLGGTQSLHTNAMDETLSLPTDRAAHIAVRTQQVLAFETGVTETIDPLAGSYFVENLTHRVEQECEKYFTRIEQEGGVLEGIKNGFFQKEIARSAYEFQQLLEKKARVIVGVNDFLEGNEEYTIPILKIDETIGRRQSQQLTSVKSGRDAAAVKRSLAALSTACHDPKVNLMEPILDCARANVSEGEIVDAMKVVFGGYREPAVF
ncbi:MAG TPA: methylmalonyl-CoA mutase family protein [Candidatus Xenobia bacterium]